MFDDDDTKDINPDETSDKASETSSASAADDVAASSAETPAAEGTDGAAAEGAEGEAAADENATPNPADDPNTVTVQPVQFASFEDLDQVQGPQNQNLNILLDVKLQLSVELGKTDLPIKKVLELTKGSIVTLNKAAGEPVELYANGKLIAFGEVVVIEDNFGLRITHITDPVKRLNTINGTVNTD